jgi:hypothetical protein
MRVEAFESLEPRQQKAQLQTILKAATVYKDGKIKLKFRGRRTGRSEVLFGIDTYVRV